MEKLSRLPSRHPLRQNKDQLVNQKVLVEAHEPMVNGPGESVRDVSARKAEVTVARG
ncbi:unnamed protein product [Tetraodon nigroviridis]|uniref:(spotted green pufferfish) hypothetical protein n=1 Tax=Tetraodon nigroviridis TaxID=99883 RepID=Q4RLK3_TETNG|nr:unnamed protein product [Tetraodon nigroviridis]